MVNGNGHSNHENYPQNSTNGSFSSETLRKYWWIIRRKLWLVLLFAIIGASYKYNAISEVKELFRSHASIILDSSSSNRAVTLLGIPRSRVGFENEMLVLRSDELARRVAVKLMDSFQKSQKLDTLNILKGDNGNLASIEQITRGVKSSVRTVSRNEEGSVINIYATAYSPEDASTIANTFAHTYKQSNIETSVKQITKAKRFLNAQIEKTSDSLYQSEINILNFYRKHGYSQSELSSNSLLERLTNLYTKLDDVRFERISLLEEAEAIDSTLRASRKNETEIILAGTDNLIKFYEDKIKQLAVEEQEEISKLSSTNNEQTNNILKNINKKLDNARANLKELLDIKLNNSTLLTTIDGSIAKFYIELNAQKTELQNKARALKRQITEINAQISETTGQLDTIPFLELELQKKQRNRQKNITLLEKFNSKKVEIELAEVSEGGFVNILDPAKPNSNPINKQKMAGVIQGGFFGIIIALIIIFGIDKLDDRIRTDEDLRSMNLNIISSIPLMDSYLRKKYRAKQYVGYKDTTILTNLITILNPQSGISEMYRRLRTNFLYSQPDKSHKTILVSSPNPKEGKSITASNLAVVLANSGKKVLLMDTDLRWPTIDIYFGIEQKPGFTDLILDDLDLKEVIKSSVVDNLHIVPAGKDVPNPSELIESNKFKTLYSKVKKEYDFVVFDSPPINSVTDAMVLSDHADQLLIVINAGKTKKKEVAQALDQLRLAEGKIAGFLLNKLSSDSFVTEYNYYKNYNYYGNRSSATSNAKIDIIKKKFNA